MPVSLVQTGVRWVIVGGGPVAERKLATLLRAGADVLVVAPRVTRGIRRQVARSRARWTRARYRPGILKGARFVLAATSDPGINRIVAREARRAGAFVGVADDPSLCTLFMPAVLRRGDLTVAVNTGGRSPGLARLMRDHLTRFVRVEQAARLRIVSSIRSRLRREVPDRVERARRLARLLRAPLLGPLRAGRGDEALRAGLRAVRLQPSRRRRHGGSS